MITAEGVMLTTRDHCVVIVYTLKIEHYNNSKSLIKFGIPSCVKEDSRKDGTERHAGTNRRQSISFNCTEVENQQKSPSFLMSLLEILEVPFTP